ncbi:MAG: hypothetical protein JSW00_14190 [Thermoplasmata archaeon]|nr:MAG: hypothetical protein JSW00_14190 [Thermoplasmata archaeon]
MQKKALVGMILVLVALVLVGLSLIMPWFSIEVLATENGEEESAVAEFYLDHAKEQYKGKVFGVPTEVTFELSYENETFKDNKSVDIFKTTRIIVFVGLIGCILGLIGAAMVMLGKIKPWMGTILVFLAVILTLIAPIYLMTSLPPTFKEEDESGTISYYPFEKMGDNFFGSDKTENENVTAELTWGGSTGWFLPIIAMILCIIALIFVATSKPAAEPVFQAQPIEQPGVVTFQPESPAPLEEPMAGPVFQPESPAGEMVFKAEPKAPPPALNIPPSLKSKGDQFQCPDCSKIFILAPGKRPAILNCPYCGLRGIVD